MFNFFNKKKVTRNAMGSLSIATDIHSHILPGLDDGSPDIETSLRLLQGIYNLGIRKTIATPHVISDMYRNTPETINAALEKLKTAAAAAEIEIEISAAAEYMLDDYFIKLFTTDSSQLLKLHDDLILTEQSYATPTGNLNEIAFELVTHNFKPIMAHPERYHFYHNDYEEFFHLKDMGFLLQVNLLSLTGFYGPAVAKAAKFLFHEELVDLVGTDMHHTKHLALLQQKENQDIWKEYLQGRKYNDLSNI